MKKKITNYLGFQASLMLGDEPFKNWTVERYLEEDLAPSITHYIFPGRGLELRCDDDEKISVIFLRSTEKDAFDDSLIEQSFSWTRKQTLEYFGSPSKSGDKRNDPILGDYGAWDRFARLEHTIRVEYKLDSSGISKITFMRNNVVPE